MGRYLPVVLSIGFLLSNGAFAQPLDLNTCDPKLFKDYVSGQHHLATTLDVLQSINETNFE
jgi:hypothetical protein